MKKERLIGMTVDPNRPGKSIGIFANYCSECQKDLPETYKGKECPFCKINLADSKQECVKAPNAPPVAEPAEGEWKCSRTKA